MLIIGGHSFGGMTAIEVAAHDRRVKACVCQDPWLFLREKEILNGQLRLRVPFFSVNTELFHPSCERDFNFNSWKALKTLYYHLEDNRAENVVIKSTHHPH